MTREPSITQWQIWQQLTSLCCIASVAEELGMLSDSLEDCVAFGCLCCNAQSWFVDDEPLPLLPMPPSKLKFLNGSSYPFSLFPYFNCMVWTQRINHIACMSWQWLWNTQALPHGQVFYKPQKPYSMTTQLEIQGAWNLHLHTEGLLGWSCWVWNWGCITYAISSHSNFRYWTPATYGLTLV